MENTNNSFYQKIKGATLPINIVAWAKGFLKLVFIDFNVYTKRNELFFHSQPTPRKNNTNAIKENRLHQQGKIISIEPSKKFNNMSNLRNSVRLIGRLGSNPDFKQFESGRSIAKVSIATNDIYRNERGDKIVETQWHNLVVWGKYAESFHKILAKGDEVAIEGKLTHRSYQDAEGTTRYVTEIVVNEFVRLSSRAIAVPPQVASA
ncbi:MAG: single-stranded DNA-binding protein [Bacteroidota bacterium]